MRSRCCYRRGGEATRWTIARHTRAITCRTSLPARWNNARRLWTPLAEAAVTLMDHLDRIQGHRAPTLEVAFRLFREGWIRVEWADELKLDKYGPLLDQSCHQWQQNKVADKGSIAKAVKKIGLAEVASVVARISERMEAQQPLELTQSPDKRLSQCFDSLLAIDGGGDVGCCACG